MIHSKSVSPSYLFDCSPKKKLPVATRFSERLRQHEEIAGQEGMIHSNNVSTPPCFPSIFLGNLSLLTVHEDEANPTPATLQSSVPHISPQKTIDCSKYPLLHSIGLETNFDNDDNTWCIQSMISELITLHKEYRKN